ncbi:MAG: DUF4097 domain-containing protein [candidate division WOR-3 bacterium]|nr:DUF4097 domain-containing protein [candidate division WOR-3 bacterium]MCX7836505.1 DUF4097 domain-containing protein [candidate division WOR-3 bacterium]MDW8114444.1 DUF4097 family beta strand repeat-containing protein [candidate division WOR-3 bacterium]
MDEKERILRLLEDGKISAEEAIRLLELLTKKEKRASFFDIFEEIPEVINEIFIKIGDSLKSHQETLFLSPRNKIIIENVGGDTQIFGKDISEIKIERRGLAKINSEKDFLKISSLKGDMKIETNYDTEIEISTIRGDFSLFSIKKKIVFQTASGKIFGKDISGKIKGETISGNMEFMIDDFSEIDLHTKSGDIFLELKEDTEAILEFYGNREKMICDFPLEVIEEREEYLKGIINKPKNLIKIRNELGRLKIRKR